MTGLSFFSKAKGLYLALMEIKKILEKIPLRGSFENVLFWGVLFFCFLAAIASTIFTAIEGLGGLAIVYTALISLYFVILGIVAFATGKNQACYTAMCFAINTFIVPPMFFICGAFDSGMPFYCLTAILVTSLINNFKIRTAMLIYSVILNVGIFFYDWFHPEISPTLEPLDGLVDQTVSFVFMAILIFTIISYLLKTYSRERKEKDEVIAKLDFLSSHDPLTGLYNRRSFIEVIKNKVLVSPAGYYLLMFDVDFFKRINDNFSHLFGDQVLASIGNLAQSTCIEEGEMAVRYGGEEFILLLRAENYSKAIVRAEQFRINVSALHFEEQPNVHVNISGGFVDCYNPEFTNYDKILTIADKRLYTAKNNGRNQIVGKK